MLAQEQAPLQLQSWSPDVLESIAPISAEVEVEVEPPPRQELPPLAVFSNETERVLQSFFARGGEFGEPSNFAAMCERAQRLCHASYPCPACDATGCSMISPEDFVARARRLEQHKGEAELLLAGARNAEERLEFENKVADARKALGLALQGEAACKICHGTGATKPRKFGRGHGDNIMTHVWCPVCEGSSSTGAPDRWELKLLVSNLAEIPGLTIRQLIAAAKAAGEQLPREGRWARAVELLRRMAWRAVGEEPALTPSFDTRAALRALVVVMRDPCPRCSGGYVVPIDVRETGCSIPPETWSADPVDILEHGEIDRILEFLREESALHAAVLASYYGIDGNRWGATPKGRLWAIMPLTKPGATLAREAGERFEREHDGMTLDPCELLARELDEDRKSALVNRRRRGQLDMADKAARNLLEAAKRAWARAVLASGHDARDTSRAHGFEADQVAAHEDRVNALLDATVASGEHIQPPLHETHAEAIAFFGSGRWEK